MTRTEAIQQQNDAHIINTYGARRLAMVRGAGSRLYDAEGREYLDCFAGIAVCNLGHCHPAVTAAITQQAGTLVHVSNLYYMEPQTKLAAKLSALCFAERWFFANSGAEANESAIKLVRRYWSQQGTPRPHIITAEHSFHGRTLAAITATGQPKYQQGFEPLMGGFSYVPYDDIAALAAAIRPETGAVMLEAIQGEGGVRVPHADYLRKVRALCDEHDLLLILDEVQTGMGRTGTMFAHEQAGITPDIMTLAKALANGVPIGAMGCTEQAAAGFGVGSHASTFGGNPLSCAAALATVEVLSAPGFLEEVQAKSAVFFQALNALADKHTKILDVRGAGFMIGVELDEPVAPLVSAMADHGVICGPAGPNVLRLLPPLVATAEELKQVAETLETCLGVLGW
ncbi:MAG: aspartate aminotransferase family protein [Candidatus Hydrogenedentes bacterium]|nr:aspartate aminotransferase family protein [Candidatus Hydrogenedentota bacterium]